MKKTLSRNQGHTLYRLAEVPSIVYYLYYTSCLHDDSSGNLCVGSQTDVDVVLLYSRVYLNNNAMRMCASYSSDIVHWK
jgi:hypothetical protein